MIRARLMLKRVRQSYLISAMTVGLVMMIILYELSEYSQYGLLESFRSAYHQGTNSFISIHKTQIIKNQLIFPYNFQVPESQLDQFIEAHSDIINMTALKNPTIYKHEFKDETTQKFDTPLTSKYLKTSFQKYNATVFDSSKEIKGNLNRCSRLTKTFDAFQISQPQNMQVSLTEILSKVYDDCQRGDDPYLNELAPFFMNELELQLKYKVVDRYWYRLAGSSVWLEQYGVHFMISRILYSPRGRRNQPVISLTYGQLFDKNWKELIHTKLVIPSFEVHPPGDSKAGADVPTETLTGDSEPSNDRKPTYKVLTFPQFLPIPFWYDFDLTDGKYYGPEDPRILLVKNKRGYEEPLVIFNAYHRKLTHFDDDFDDQVVMKGQFYRSMFMCWPWQFQYGKENTDGVSNANFDKKLYNKVIELKLKTLPRQKIQKNWTPFISQFTRDKYGHDKYINFVYRLANLETLKCDLTGDTGECVFSYRLNNKLNPSGNIGPLRGGTELVNLNRLLKTNSQVPDLKYLLPPNREIWVGFARAHLDDCGCGNNMYRPNLVIVVRDMVELPDEKDDGKHEKQYQNLFKVSHVSSSISFDIPIIGWNLMDPKDLCAGSNVLIPNGISFWTINSFQSGKKWVSEDYLSLTLSISDFTVHRIEIKGLLNQLLNEKSLFIPPRTAQLSDSELEVPNTKIINDYKKSGGYNNDNILCGLQSSTEFCKNYGLEQATLYASNNKLYDDLEYSMHHGKTSHHKIHDDEDYYYEEDEEDENIDEDVEKYKEALDLKNIKASLQNFSNRPGGKNAQDQTPGSKQDSKSQKANDAKPGSLPKVVQSPKVGQYSRPDKVEDGHVQPSIDDEDEQPSIDDEDTDPSIDDEETESSIENEDESDEQSDTSATSEKETVKENNKNGKGKNDPTKKPSQDNSNSVKEGTDKSTKKPVDDNKVTNPAKEPSSDASLTGKNNADAKNSQKLKGAANGDITEKTSKGKSPKADKLIDKKVTGGKSTNNSQKGTEDKAIVSNEKGSKGKEVSNGNKAGYEQKTSGKKGTGKSVTSNVKKPTINAEKGYVDKPKDKIPTQDEVSVVKKPAGKEAAKDESSNDKDPAEVESAQPQKEAANEEKSSKDKAPAAAKVSGAKKPATKAGKEPTNDKSWKDKTSVKAEVGEARNSAGKLPESAQKDSV